MSANWKQNLRRPRWLRNESGMALIELAFAVPFLFVLAFGMLDFGLAWSRQMALANTVRAGMQFALVHKPTQEETTDVENAIAAAAPNGYEGTTQVTFYCECPTQGVVLCTVLCADTSRPETLMGISVIEDYDLLVNYPFLGKTLTLGEIRVVRLG